MACRCPCNKHKEEETYYYEREPFSDDDYDEGSPYDWTTVKECFEADRAIAFYGRVCGDLEWCPIPGTPDEKIEESVLRKKEELLLRNCTTHQSASRDRMLLEQCLSITPHLFTPREAGRWASKELLFRFVRESLVEEECGYWKDDEAIRQCLEGKQPDNDVQAYGETRNFIRAYLKFHRWAREKDGGLLTVGMLKEVHRVLMRGLPGHERSGKWSDRPRCVEFEGVLHWYASPEKLEEEMQRLVDEYNRRRKAEDGCDGMKLLEIMGEWLVRFLEIHPFYDGNGRMARLVLAYAMEAYGIPAPVWIKVWPEDDRVEGKEEEAAAEGGRRWARMLARCHWEGKDDWKVFRVLLTSATVVLELREIYRLLGYVLTEGTSSDLPEVLNEAVVSELRKMREVYRSTRPEVEEEEEDLR